MEIRPELAQVRPQPIRSGQDHPVYDRVRKLLVVRDDRLGDLVLTLPALDRLRAAYPEAVIGLLVQPALAPLASLFSPVDRILETGDTNAIREFAPDVAVCISRRPAAAWALRRAGVHRMTGTGRRLFSFLFDRTVTGSRRATSRHEVEHALDLAARAGAPAGPVRFPIEIPTDAHASVDVWLEDNEISTDPLVIHPGTAGSCPGWPVENWCRLAVELRAAKHAVVITEGPADRNAVQPFVDRKFPRFARGLPELAALLARARLVASNSTGPIHLANAVGSPTLAIHAPWKSCGAQRWGPYGSRGWALVAGPSDVPYGSRRRRLRRAGELMARLGVDTVLTAVRSMIATGRPRIDGWPNPDEETWTPNDPGVHY